MPTAKSECWTPFASAAPFSPESVVEEYAGVLKHYGLRTVEGDRYAGEWPAEAFKSHGITYIGAKQPKSQIYLDVLPRINSGEVSLLDSPRRGISALRGPLAVVLVSFRAGTVRRGSGLRLPHLVGG
jgi:hypothetical protein